MEIKRFNEFNVSESNEYGKDILSDDQHGASILGLQRLPSNIRSRQSQNFYDYYSRRRFSGKSKYELNTEVFNLAQRKDEIGILAQFCLQLERESIVSDIEIIDDIK